MSSAIRKNEFVADTVALVVRIEQRRLGKIASEAFATVEEGAARLYVPAIALAEILYLAERRRITATLSDLRKYMQDYPTCVEQPLNFEIVVAAQRITDIPELHDRLIAATAAYLRVPLLTDDMKITASYYVKALW